MGKGFFNDCDLGGERRVDGCFFQRSVWLLAPGLVRSKGDSRLYTARLSTHRARGILCPPQPRYTRLTRTRCGGHRPRPIRRRRWDMAMRRRVKQQFSVSFVEFDRFSGGSCLPKVSYKLFTCEKHTFIRPPTVPQPIPPKQIQRHSTLRVDHHREGRLGC